MPDERIEDLAALALRKLESVRSRIVRLKADLAEAEVEERILDGLLNPSRHAGGRSTRAAVQQRQDAMVAVLRQCGPLRPADLHQKAQEALGDDDEISKQTVNDLLRRKSDVFVNLENATWGLVGIHDAPAAPPPPHRPAPPGSPRPPPAAPIAPPMRPPPPRIAPPAPPPPRAAAPSSGNSPFANTMDADEAPF